MMKRDVSTLSPCRCDTGNYCRRHRRYTTKSEPPPRKAGVLYGLDPLETNQRCGGGVRIIRNQGGRE